MSKSSSRKNLLKLPEKDISGRPPRQAVFLAQFDNLDEVRTFVGQEAEEYGLDPQAVYAVQLAVDEAFSNIIEHAYGGECVQVIECVCYVAKDELVIQLKDCGAPFDPVKVTDPDLVSDLQDRQVGGLGLYFMRQLMDQVDFTFQPALQDQAGCNVLRLVKRKRKAG